MIQRGRGEKEGERVTMGRVMILPRTVKRQEKPRGVHTDMRSTPSMETREYRNGR